MRSEKVRRRGSTWRHCAEQWALGVAFLVVFSVFSSILLASREGATYRIAADEIACAAGLQSSPSFAMSDTSVGQAVDPGAAQSTGYRVEAGVVRAWKEQETIESCVEVLLGKEQGTPDGYNGDLCLDVADIVWLLLQGE